MFKGMSYRKFLHRFQDEDSCKQYLYDLKWENGFLCRRCNNKTHWKGRTEFHARCTKCGYDESLTAHTIFHKLQVPLLKAFCIVFHITVFKKGISCKNLSEIVEVSQKSVWLIKRKAQEAMGVCFLEGDRAYHQLRDCILDGIILSHRAKQLNGLQRIRLIRRKMSGRAKDNSRHYIRLKSDQPAFDPCNLVGGRYVDEGKDILMWNFRNWLTGIHHHCSEKYLRGYIDEYCFRLNHRRKKNTVWHSLICEMIRAKPYVVHDNAAKS